MENTLSDKARQANLPLTGRFLIEAWAELIGYEAKYFRESIKRSNVRTIVFGNMVVIDAAWFWQDLIGCPTEEEPTAKEASLKKQKAEEKPAVTESRSRAGKTGKGSEKPE